MSKIIPDAREIIKYIEDNDIKFVRLAFCDIYGSQKNVSVLSSALGSALEDGVTIEAGAVLPEAAGELTLLPDRTTLATLPWRPSHGRVCRLWCDLIDSDSSEGDASELCARSILRKTEEAAHEAGISIGMSADCEFYLFRLDDDGERTNIPMDSAGYLDVAPSDKGENVRRAICLSLEELGIYPQRSMHKHGPGQNEITFRAAPPLSAADNLMALKNAVAAVAGQNGLWASFERAPLESKPDNSVGITITAARPSIQSKDAFALSEAFAEGIRKNADVISRYFLPDARRLSVTVKNRSGMPKIELAAPDCKFNPYIVYALLIRAGLCEITAEMPPADQWLPECVRRAYL